MCWTEFNKASRMPIENTIGRCDIFPRQLWFSQTVIQLIQFCSLYSVSFYHVCEYSSFITLEASNRTCRENYCVEGLPVALEGHGFCGFTDYACYKRPQWSRGSVVAFGTQVCGFAPGRSRQIFRAKNSSARLPSEGK
jgi:hypothetical protein